MKITGKGGKEYDIEYAYAPTINNRLVIQYPGNHTFADVAKAFEGVESFHVTNGDSECDYDGYTCITYMNRNANGINIQLVKG